MGHGQPVRVIGLNPHVELPEQGALIVAFFQELRKRDIVGRHHRIGQVILANWIKNVASKWKPALKEAGTARRARWICPVIAKPDTRLCNLINDRH